MATIVQTQALLETIIASVIAGVGISFTFSLAIWGAARFVDLSRGERPLAAGGAAALGLLSIAVTITAVVLGIVVMTSK